MKSPLDMSLQGSYVSLPKLESKNQIVFKNNTLKKRISFIRESQDNINKLELLSQEFSKENELNESLIQLPTNLQGYNSYSVIQQQKEESNNKHHEGRNSQHSTRPSIYDQLKLSNSHSRKKNKTYLFTGNDRLNTIEGKDVGDNLLKKLDIKSDKNADKLRRIVTFQNQQQQKFKKFVIQKNHSHINHNEDEDQFIKDNWNEQQKHQLQTGETLSFLFKNLGENLQNFVKYKSEKYCIKSIEKYVNYNKRLSKLIDITNTPFKDYNATLLLQRYFKILYKQISISKYKSAQTELQFTRTNLNTIYTQNNTKTSLFPTQTRNTSIKGEQSFTGEVKLNKDQNQFLHDKQFLDNILDFNYRLEEWIMGMQKSQIQLFQSQLVDITEQVYQKETVLKQQLVNHLKKYSYLELTEAINNKYQLNLRVMKSKLAEQLRTFEEKNGDIKLINKQSINRGECIDRVISGIEKLDLQ